jgi:hypothetical protein
MPLSASGNTPLRSWLGSEPGAPTSGMVSLIASVAGGAQFVRIMHQSIAATGL